MKKIKVILFLLILCIFVVFPSKQVKADELAPASDKHGSGSYQLNSVPGDYRFYTEYFVEAGSTKSITTAGIDRRTSIKVYANKDEYILFGSSVAKSQIDVDNNYTRSVTDVDIVITTPDGGKIPFNVLLPGEEEEDGTYRVNGLGYIQSPTQEMNGPMVNYSDEGDPTNYYVPLTYLVETSGVYTFEFHSVTGFNPNSAQSGDLPTPKKASEQWAQGNTSVAAWDVTVLGKKDATEWEVKSGRAWADYLALTTAGSYVGSTTNIVKSDLNVHVLSHDGYLYKVDFNKAAPYGFIFFANNTGFMTAVTDEIGNTSYRPVYHSFYDSSNDLDGMSANENIYLHKPNEKDTELYETYKIFFNAPNSDLQGKEYTRFGEIDKIKTSPDVSVDIQDLTFTGVSDNIATTGHGGYFTFHSTGEAMVTIRLDLRRAIFESEGTMDEYKGSGIVEITAPAFKTYDDVSGTHVNVNSVYWDGKDTDGIVIPAGIYGDNNVVISTEVKRGELHFPVIDMEGLYDGLTVERLNGTGITAANKYDLYYNNNPLEYGTIEGKDVKRVTSGPYYLLSDGTKSYKVYSDTLLGSKYFNGVSSNSVSTLVKDDKEYLTQKLFGISYTDPALSPTQKAIIDAEFETELATYHYEPINSNSVKMKFYAEGYDGGGNKSGIDAWTYYSSGIDSDIISFAVLDTTYRGVVRGQIFYDAHDASGYPDSVFDVSDGDYLLSGIKVRLIDGDGNPLVHKENLPAFDETGHFKYDANGKIIFEETDVDYEAVTDSTGTYRFTSVPFSKDDAKTYYVQVMLTDVQSEVLRYACTTSVNIKNNLKVAGGASFIPGTIDTGTYGADGNTIVDANDSSKIYKYKYERDDNNEIVFAKSQKDNLDYVQSVTFLKDEKPKTGDLVVVKEFKMIGFSSTVPSANQKNYKVVKDWGTDSQGNIHKPTDGLIVELWVWNDNKVQEVNTHDLTRRTGALVDTQILNDVNGWSYTWKKLDDRLQYYVLEYYTAKKADGEPITNDRGEPRKVLVGGTMPIYSDPTTISNNTDGIYGFDVSAGAYPEIITVAGKPRIPIQKFVEGQSFDHSNALTDKERLESIENNARQYNVTYTLTTENSGSTNVITLHNSQIYDDRAYYVWFNHETELPDMIALTYVDTVAGKHAKKTEPVPLQKDTNHPVGDVAEGKFAIKGLSVSSVDAAYGGNSEGNATEVFTVKADGNDYALFTPTIYGNYKSGTGTRTYRVKYVVDKTTKNPVSVTIDDTTGELIEYGTGKKIEKLPDANDFIVYSWYMTIHVYDVQPDTIEYDPDGGTIVLQEALTAGKELTYELIIDENNENSIEYISNDKRTNGILSNDTYRLPLYKHAEHPDMGTCADFVGIAWAGSFAFEDGDISSLPFSDTYESRYGSQDFDQDGELGEVKKDGVAIAGGNGGEIAIELNTQRFSSVNRTQDHANYAKVTFTPYTDSMAKAFGPADDVFYYKVVVFAEDNLYLYTTYDEINALEGVEMYTYITMRPKEKSGGGNTEDDDNNGPTNSDDNNDDDKSGINLGTGTPQTGDDNNVMLWLCLSALALAIISAGTFRILKRD